MRFLLERLDPAPASPEDWERLGVFMLTHRDSPGGGMVASMVVPPDVAKEMRRQMALLNDVLDVEESAVESAG
jgi:hypothetical protein